MEDKERRDEVVLKNELDPIKRLIMAEELIRYLNEQYGTPTLEEWITWE